MSALPVLVATRNPGKMREYRALLAPLGARLLFPSDLDLRVDPAETGETYLENARIKARAHWQALRGRGLSAVVVADDSGLEVDALGGAPGIRSARYAQGSDMDRLEALLEALKDVPWEQRTARFRCVLVMIAPSGEEYSSQGVCEGMIALEPAGTRGFGYDPVFYVPRLGRTIAQLPAEVKNRISHRALAVQAAMPALERLLLA